MRIPLQFRKSVSQVRESLEIASMRQHGFIDEVVIRTSLISYATRKARALQVVRACLRGDVNDDITAQRAVLERMHSRGCSPCEGRTQERYIKTLEGNL